MTQLPSAAYCCILGWIFMEFALLIRAWALVEIVIILFLRDL